MATDKSPVMLELLGARARQEGLKIETRVMDGHALELDDNSFDMAGSQFGVMLFPDMPKGIKEMGRVVQPGGHVLMNVYGDPHKIEFFEFLVGAILSVRPDFNGPPMNPPPLPFQLQNLCISLFLPFVGVYLNSRAACNNAARAPFRGAATSLDS